jgi:hypothetical protein
MEMVNGWLMSVQCSVSILHQAICPFLSHALTIFPDNYWLLPDLKEKDSPIWIGAMPKTEKCINMSSNSNEREL